MFTEVRRPSQADRALPAIPFHSKKDEIKKTLHFENLIGFLAQIIPDTESNNFLRGATYSHDLINMLSDQEFALDERTSSVFLAKAIHEAKTRAIQQKTEFDFVQVIELKKGKEFLMHSISLVSHENPDLSAHFSSFKNLYTKLGAHLVLALSEEQLSQPENEPVKLPAGRGELLQSA